MNSILLSKMSKAMLAETKGEEVAVQTEEEMLEEDKAYIEQVASLDQTQNTPFIFKPYIERVFYIFLSRPSIHPVLCTLCDAP